MRGRTIRYSLDELAFVYLRREMPRAEMHAAFVEWFGRDDVSIVHLKALCNRRGWQTGRDGRFEPGAVSANKGRKMPFNPNSARTRFREGERRGQAAFLHKPVGAERVTRDGYLERKIHDGLPMQSRWRAVHLLRWEERHGPVPEGHCLKCLDGDRTNTDPANWEALPRALLPRLDGRSGRGYETAAAEIRPTVMAVAKLEHAARERLRGPVAATAPGGDMRPGRRRRSSGAAPG